MGVPGSTGSCTVSSCIDDTLTDHAYHLTTTTDMDGHNGAMQATDKILRYHQVGGGLMCVAIIERSFRATRWRVHITRSRFDVSRLYASAFSNTRLSTFC